MNKVLIIGLFLLMPLVSFAQWDDCPHGKTNDSCEYPGECGRYTDTNNDGICDHSQEAPVVTSTTTQTNATQSKTQTTTTKTSKNYPLFIIAAIVSILYGVTYILAKNKTITILTHRKIWNSVLTVAFFATSLMGVALIIQINSEKVFNLPFNLLYWHVVTGIVMMIVAFFHIGWHWKYYKNLFK
jgi:hypothetical protein